MSAEIDSLRCYDADLPYTPQNRFGTPAGFRDEDYFIPFTLTIPTPPVVGPGPQLTPITRNVPIQMDDDVPFIWLSVIFPAAGLTKTTIASVPTSGLPLFLAWRDTRGNPLSDGLVLTMGAWCQSGFGSNGAGFPLDEPVECDAGGCLTVDYQGLNTGGDTHATLIVSGVAESMLFTAVTAGTAGNSITVAWGGSFPGPAGLVITVVGNAVSVALATDAGNNVITTFADLQAAFAADVAVSALFTTSISGTAPDEVFVATSGDFPRHLGGGGGVLTLSGVLYGKKRYPLCVGAAE